MEALRKSVGVESRRSERSGPMDELLLSVRRAGEGEECRDGERREAAEVFGDKPGDLGPGVA